MDVDEIETAWSLRMTMQIEPCRRLTGAIKARRKLSKQEEYELLLLNASLARADGDIAAAENFLRDARGQAIAAKLPPHFQLDFQAGNNLFLRGRFAEALELFLRARLLARRPLDRAAALGNALFCCENLGIPSGSLLAELNATASALQDPVSRQTILEQIDAMQMRTAFRNARGGYIWQGPNRPRRAQAHWFQSWAAALPYLRSPESVRARAITDFDCELHLFSFRMRTLFPIMAGDVGSAPKVSHQIDRVYLWTWRWILGEAAVSDLMLSEALKVFSLDELRETATKEDIQLLALALRWLALFNPSMRPAAMRFAKAFEPPESEWFEAPRFERDLTIALTTGKQASARRRFLLDKLYSHWVFKDPNYVWPKAVAILQDRLTLSQPRRKTSPALGKVEFDTASGLVRSGDKETISRAICLLFDALSDGSSIVFSQALEICFAIAPFDEDAHRSKIQNLLARARAFLPPSLKLRVRGDWIHAIGDWQALTPIPATTEPIALPDWLRERTAQSMPRHDRWIRPRVALKGAQPGSKLSRRELEALIGRSKATVHRLLQEWEQQGLVSRIGRGRQSRYLVNLAPTIEDS